MSTQLLTGPITAVGQIEAGKMTAESLNNQANNLDSQAQEAEDKGKYDQMREQMIGDFKVGQSTAAYGAAGVKMDSGSVLDVMQASHQNIELDRLNIAHGADIRALNYKNQAAMNRFGGQSALLGSYWAALGSFTGAGISGDAFTKSGSPNGSGASAAESAPDASAQSGGEGASMGEAGAGAGGEAGAADAAALA